MSEGPKQATAIAAPADAGEGEAAATNADEAAGAPDTGGQDAGTVAAPATDPEAVRKKKRKRKLEVVDPVTRLRHSIESGPPRRWERRLVEVRTCVGGPIKLLRWVPMGPPNLLELAAEAHAASEGAGADRTPPPRGTTPADSADGGRPRGGDTQADEEQRRVAAAAAAAATAAAHAAAAVAAAKAAAATPAASGDPAAGGEAAAAADGAGGYEAVGDGVRCPECGKVLKHVDSLRKHIRNVHGEKHLVCDWPGCGRAFAEPSKLARHRQGHEKAAQDEAAAGGAGAAVAGGAADG